MQGRTSILQAPLRIENSNSITSMCHQVLVSAKPSWLPTKEAKNLLHQLLTLSSAMSNFSPQHMQRYLTTSKCPFLEAVWRRVLFSWSHKVNHCLCRTQTAQSHKTCLQRTSSQKSFLCYARTNVLENLQVASSAACPQSMNWIQFPRALPNNQHKIGNAASFEQLLISSSTCSLWFVFKNDSMFCAEAAVFCAVALGC